MVSASSDMLLSVGDVFEQVKCVDFLYVCWDISIHLMEHSRRVSEDAKKRGHMQYTQVRSSKMQRVYKKILWLLVGMVIART